MPKRSAPVPNKEELVDQPVDKKVKTQVGQPPRRSLLNPSVLRSIFKLNTLRSKAKKEVENCCRNLFFGNRSMAFKRTPTLHSLSQLDRPHVNITKPKIKLRCPKLAKPKRPKLKTKRRARTCNNLEGAMMEHKYDEDQDEADPQLCICAGMKMIHRVPEGLGSIEEFKPRVELHPLVDPRVDIRPATMGYRHKCSAGHRRYRS